MEALECLQKTLKEQADGLNRIYTPNQPGNYQINNYQDNNYQGNNFRENSWNPRGRGRGGNKGRGRVDWTPGRNNQQQQQQPQQTSRFHWVRTDEGNVTDVLDDDSNIDWGYWGYLEDEPQTAVNNTQAKTTDTTTSNKTE